MRLGLDATMRSAARTVGARYRYRQLAMNEIPALNALYNACHGTTRPLAEAEWLFRENPNGPAVIMAAFDDEDTLVGVRPALPWKYVWRGAAWTAYEFADAMVAPSHRNRGIFKQLLRQMYAFAGEGDVLLFTIPNGNSLPVYERMPEFTVLGHSETRVKPISWPRYIGYRLGVDGHGAPHPGAAESVHLKNGDTRLTAIDRFDSDFESTHSELAEEISGYTLRSAAFLQWRYFGSPVRQYKVAYIEQRGHVRGYIVVRLIHRVAHVLDFFVRPDRQLACRAFGLLIDWVTALGAIACHFNASRGNVFHEVASQCGFWLKKTSGTLVVDRRSAEQFASAGGRPLDLAQLYFVMGDFDFF
ncbi:MAG: GNAT family N-acetyltransferase [Betaproteobacteria bacterium]